MPDAPAGSTPFRGRAEAFDGGILTLPRAAVKNDGCEQAATEPPRGRLFVHPGDEIYKGMIVGENAQPNDRHANIVE